ncbi:TetR/AcrR family transcriptional regulator [Leptospira yasudae]|uniref:TetR/AcrR family transcriptional regulator n=1 Tax=Leptospira yasudae TaxID=2202201 RepID=A0A6N4QWK4_9LEPT|nr:TetR/AcrR family transcriptional regulator [Leptospira yasudae]TGL75914.1 TetR/AcrR family transcriptional regulator [Leptospira yasudae]TGL81653.1 TetR/AcrR family transcriptional regulator [Leptospira yasudae]TGL88513.1 TetR/AcrR family transcriptional regulator [Leptospira yasudae]
MKLSAADSAAKRKTILAAGIRLIRQNGPDGIGIQEIADEAEIPKGSFYNYFPSKDRFLIEALEDYTRNAISWNDQALQKAGYGRFALFSLYEEKVTLEKQFLKDGLSCLISVLSQHSSEKKPELRKELGRSLDAIANAILNSLQVSADDSTADKILLLIRTVEASWRGAMLLARATGDESYLENFLSVHRNLILGKEL